jgi:hypothetical protein
MRRIPGLFVTGGRFQSFFSGGRSGLGVGFFGGADTGRRINRSATMAPVRQTATRITTPTTAFLSWDVTSTPFFPAAFFLGEDVFFFPAAFLKMPIFRRFFFTCHLIY